MNLFKYFLALAFLLSPLVALRADGPPPSRGTSPSIKPVVNDDKDWTIEAGSGVLFADVRTDLPGYTLVPANLTASLKVDEVSLDDYAGGWLRGNTEFFFRGEGLAVVHGTESRFVGISFGPRYNFVQKGWKWVPYIESSVGFAFNDSRGMTSPTRGQIGQGQDFSFQFGIAAGARYDITSDWFLRLSGVYTHYSNAGLSEPGRKNRALDAAGPELAFGYRF